MRFRVVFFSLVVWPLYTSSICREIWESAQRFKKGEKNTLFRVWISQSDKKRIFSSNCPLTHSSSHYRFTHISLITRGKNNATWLLRRFRLRFGHFCSLSFFSLYFSLSLSLFVCVFGETNGFNFRIVLLRVTRWSNFGLKTAAPSFALSHHETTWQRQLFSLVATNAHPLCVTLLRRKKE